MNINQKLIADLQKSYCIIPCLDEKNRPLGDWKQYIKNTKLNTETIPTHDIYILLRKTDDLVCLTINPNSFSLDPRERMLWTKNLIHPLEIGYKLKDYSYIETDEQGQYHIFFRIKDISSIKNTIIAKKDEKTIVEVIAEGLIQLYPSFHFHIKSNISSVLTLPFVTIEYLNDIIREICGYTKSSVVQFSNTKVKVKKKVNYD
jgi:hypothetical protein